ncbi:MAG: hypothetical protein E7163_00600 [Firmicutes bacterium]|nr:hypothetical protein [Bacillota bacterium]
MDILYKLRIKKYLLLGEYDYIVDGLKYNYDEVMQLISEKDIGPLIDYMKHGYYSTTLFLLLDKANKEQRKVIIKHHIERRTSLAYSKYYIKYFEEFFDIALLTKNDNMLITLAQIADKNPEKYKDKIKIIKNYFLRLKLNGDHLILMKLNSFRNEEFENKIIEFNSNYYVIKYINILDVKQAKEFIKKYLTKKDFTYETIWELASKFKEKKEYYNEIISITKEIENKKVQSELLLMLYKINPDYTNLIDDIINLNDINVITKLTNLIEEEKQNELITQAIEENDKTKIFALAVTTDSVMTYKAIDSILEEDNFTKNVYLLSSLNGRFISYTLDKLIKNKDSKYYLNLMKELYLINSINLLETINFIFRYHHEHLFDSKIVNKIKEYLNDDKKMNRSLKIK